MDHSLVGEYAKLHSRHRYGATARHALADMLPHILALRPASLIDFGCGQSDLAFLIAAKACIGEIHRYDPAIPAISILPAVRVDLAVNVDVMEHIPDEEIDAVLASIAALATHALLVIDTGPAKILLSDGRNAHVSQHGASWWLERLRPHFPAIRQMPIHRRNRVAFKTWDGEVGGLAGFSVRMRERAIYRVQKLSRSAQRKLLGPGVHGAVL
ncbi:methyltransferase domain-containing protein [Ancylobacter pratisalsi]|uniref:Class I SAM-dependent methyltransferase n=1 Tax=Ancylobacter pratisalsi TaxID=1745854 RepID=A0A6P1YI10_9HYPH|nr:methyltransferase domain-containing protein [Ancylobacter pratisalsi]QIB32600.1 class I SAM-dependent methyltransferase [Ancylobacter pratisalsi]